MTTILYYYVCLSVCLPVCASGAGAKTKFSSISRENGNSIKSWSVRHINASSKGVILRNKLKGPAIA